EWAEDLAGQRLQWGCGDHIYGCQGDLLAASATHAYGRPHRRLWRRLLCAEDQASNRSRIRNTGWCCHYRVLLRKELNPGPTMSIEKIPAYANLIGLVAGALTTLSFVPQLLRTLRTRRAGDVAYGMLMIFITGVTLWLIYGLMLRSLPI